MTEVTTRIPLAEVTNCKTPQEVHKLLGSAGAKLSHGELVNPWRMYEDTISKEIVCIQQED